MIHTQSTTQLYQATVPHLQTTLSLPSSPMSLLLMVLLELMVSDMVCSWLTYGWRALAACLSSVRRYASWPEGFHQYCYAFCTGYTYSPVLSIVSMLQTIFSEWYKYIYKYVLVNKPLVMCLRTSWYRCVYHQWHGNPLEDYFCEYKDSLY